MKLPIHLEFILRDFDLRDEFRYVLDYLIKFLGDFPFTLQDIIEKISSIVQWRTGEVSATEDLWLLKRVLMVKKNVKDKLVLSFVNELRLD
jgi:hypothetical protein